MNSSINLISDKKQSTLVSMLNKLRLLRLVAMGLLFLVSTSAMALYIMITLSPLPKLKEQEATAIASLAQFHPDMAKLQIVNERLTSIDAILKQRTSFVPLLDSIKAKMPNDLSLTSYSLEKGLVSVTVSGRSLSSINQFLDTLKKAAEEEKEFSNVTVSSLTTDSTQNAYVLTVAIVTQQGNGMKQKN